jgi:hypothetical protein
MGKEEVSLFDASTLLGNINDPSKKVNKPATNQPKVMSVSNNINFDLQPKEGVNIVNSTNVWKTGLNKNANVDFTLQGTGKPKPEYVDKLIEKTEKVTFPEVKPIINKVEEKPIINRVEEKPIINKVEEKPITTDDKELEDSLNNLQLKQKGQFVINHDTPDYSNVKSRIDNTTKINKDILNEEDIANEELKKQYQQIQKDKQDKLKAYRDMVNKMKSDKRVEQGNKV